MEPAAPVMEPSRTTFCDLAPPLRHLEPHECRTVVKRRRQVLLMSGRKSLNTRTKDCVAPVVTATSTPTAKSGARAETRFAGALSGYSNHFVQPENFVSCCDTNAPGKSPAHQRQPQDRLSRVSSCRFELSFLKNCGGPVNAEGVQNNLISQGQVATVQHDSVGITDDGIARDTPRLMSVGATAMITN